MEQPPGDRGRLDLAVTPMKIGENEVESENLPVARCAVMRLRQATVLFLALAGVALACHRRVASGGPALFYDPVSTVPVAGVGPATGAHGIARPSKAEDSDGLDIRPAGVKTGTRSAPSRYAYDCEYTDCDLTREGKYKVIKLSGGFSPAYDLVMADGSEIPEEDYTGLMNRLVLRNKDAATDDNGSGSSLRADNGEQNVQNLVAAPAKAQTGRWRGPVMLKMPEDPLKGVKIMLVPEKSGTQSLKKLMSIPEEDSL